MFVILSLLIGAGAMAQKHNKEKQDKGTVVKQKGATYRDGTCAPTSYNLCSTNVLYHETHSNFSFLTYNSVNYERTLLCRMKFMMSIRMGIIYYNFVKLGLAGAPIGFNFLFGGGKWLFDTGLGGTYLFIYKNYDATRGKYNDQVHCVGVNVHVGVRYEIQKAFFFKAVFDPMYMVLGQKDVPLMKSPFQPMVGIGLGYTFNH